MGEIYIVTLQWYINDIHGSYDVYIHTDHTYLSGFSLFLYKDNVFVNIYCPHGPQWSSFAKSTRFLMVLFPWSIDHLPKCITGLFRKGKSQEIYLRKSLLMYMIVDIHHSHIFLYHFLNITIFSAVSRWVVTCTFLLYMGRTWTRFASNTTRAILFISPNKSYSPFVFSEPYPDNI